MNNQKMLLNKLLSNDVTIVNEAVTALIGHANLQKKWTLRVIETAIKQMAGKENIKFYSPQSAMLVEPHAAAMQLGEIIHYNLMFEDVARTQRLIIHSKKAKEEMEYYIKGSGKENKVRIMYAILGVQMQMRIILAQNKYVGDYCSYCGNHLLSGHDECDVCGRVKGSIIATGTFLGSLGMLPLSAGLFVLGKLIFSGNRSRFPGMRKGPSALCGRE